mgnify:CR=1 FL=1
MASDKESFYPGAVIGMGRRVLSGDIPAIASRQYHKFQSRPNYISDAASGQSSFLDKHPEFAVTAGSLFQVLSDLKYCH